MSHVEAIQTSHAKLTGYLNSRPKMKIFKQKKYDTAIDQYGTLLSKFLTTNEDQDRKPVNELKKWIESPFSCGKDILEIQYAVKNLWDNPKDFSDHALSLIKLDDEFTEINKKFRAMGSALKAKEYMTIITKLVNLIKFIDEQKIGGLAPGYLKTLFDNLLEMKQILKDYKNNHNDIDRVFDKTKREVNELSNQFGALLALVDLLKISTLFEIKTQYPSAKWVFPVIEEAPSSFILADPASHPGLHYSTIFGSRIGSSNICFPQPIHIKIGLPNSIGTIITGPNIYGKTTILTSLAWWVTLAQIGAPLPGNIRISPFKNLLFFSGEENQDLGLGLSGFSGEMAQWSEDNILCLGPKTLFLGDELFKTTDPAIGRKLQYSTWLNLLKARNVRWVSTTHYREGLESFASNYGEELQILQVGKNFIPRKDIKNKDFSISHGIYQGEYTLGTAELYLPEEVIKGALAF